jgi:hypothetical protein
MGLPRDDVKKPQNLYFETDEKGKFRAPFARMGWTCAMLHTSRHPPLHHLHR